MSIDNWTSQGIDAVAAIAFGALPCPFCFSDDVLIVQLGRTGDDDPLWHVDCSDCGGQGAMQDSKSEAVTSWNGVRLNPNANLECKHA